MIVMEKDDSVLSNRVVPFRLFLSNGTAPDTGASNKTLMFSQAGRPQQSAGSVSAISANAGMYYGVLTQSAISVLGGIAVWYDQGDFPQHVANVQVVNYNPFSSFSNIAAKAYSGVSFETSNIKPAAYSGVTVGIDNIKAASYSGVSVGALDIKPASYSGVTLGVDNVKPAAYSGVTFAINDIAPKVYSGVSVEVKAGGIQTASVGVGNYSGVSLGVLDIKPAIYSGVSVEVKTGGLQASSFGPSSVDAAALSTDAAQEIADRLLLRDIAGGADSGRSVGEAFFALRNRTQLSALSYIVYQNDDTAIAWHASIATVDSTVRVTDVNP